MGKAEAQNATVKVNLNSDFTGTDFRETFQSAFTKENAMHFENGSMIHNDPFTCCQMTNFITEEEFLDGLESELQQLDFDEKNNDLYKFKQTDSLLNVKDNGRTPHIKALRDFLARDVLSWVRSITGLPLADTIDVTCSQYGYTDTLLCHDDELEGRRVAFILYVTPSDWTKQDGGQLALFNRDEHGQPKNKTKSFLPKRNNFVFFEVTHKSFHEVEEVLSENKVRLSVAGWFHGPAVQRPEPYIEPTLPLCRAADIDIDIVNEWLNPTYLDVEKYIQPIQKDFEDASEIQVENFFLDDKFEGISQAIRSSSIVWQKQGPPNKRNMFEADIESLPSELKDCTNFLQSEFMFYLLSNMTGLNLSNQDQEDEGVEAKKRKLDLAHSLPGCRIAFRKWCHGCYSLGHDTNTEGNEFALDVSIFTGCDDWREQFGGYTSYIAKGEDEELLTVHPTNNSLALVYRDRDTIRFTKHINHRITETDRPEFYEISMVYYE